MADIVLTESSHGGAMAAQVGDTITVQLAEAPSTGYRWQLAAVDSNALEAIGDEFRPNAQASMGGAGVRVFRFRAKGRGTTSLELKLARPWESGPPRAVFAVRLDLG